MPRADRELGRAEPRKELPDPSTSAPRRPSRTWFALTAVICGAVVAVGAWIGDPAGETKAGPQQADVRRPTTAELETLHRAEQLLIRTCMKQQGFLYWPVPRLPAPDFRDFPYVVDDIAWAKVHGYGRDIEQRLDQEEPASPRARYYRSLPPQRQQAMGIALNGPASTGLEARSPLGGTLNHSDQGCTVASWRRLYGDVQTWYRSSETVSNLFGMRTGRVTADPAYQASVAAWSRCMNKRGYIATDPQELRATQLGKHGPDAERQDVPTATAEAECARSTGLTTTAHTLDRRTADALRTQYRAAFDAMWRMQTAALPTARSVVDHG